MKSATKKRKAEKRLEPRQKAFDETPELRRNSAHMTKRPGSNKK